MSICFFFASCQHCIFIVGCYSITWQTGNMLRLIIDRQLKHTLTNKRALVNYNLQSYFLVLLRIYYSFMEVCRTLLPFPYGGMSNQSPTQTRGLTRQGLAAPSSHGAGKLALL